MKPVKKATKIVKVKKPAQKEIKKPIITATEKIEVKEQEIKVTAPEYQATPTAFIKIAPGIMIEREQKNDWRNPKHELPTVNGPVKVMVNGNERTIEWLNNHFRDEGGNMFHEVIESWKY